MKEFLDKENKKIKKHIYIGKNFNELFYFTGNYDAEGFPEFEIYGADKKIYSLYAPLIKNLIKLTKEEIKLEIKKSSEKASWIEKRLKK